MRNVKPDADTRTIRINALARVEGEGRLHLQLQGGQVLDARLDIFEPPRFYEAFLRGRDFREVPDITARICGICPVAYLMSSCHALEDALGVSDRIGTVLHTLRSLLVCGEFIESHALHIFMLHLPDFLGYESAISMAADHGPTVQKALRIKKAGNDILTLLGGRSVHPINICVGGFYSLPSAQQWEPLLPELRACLDEMCELTLFLAQNVQFPDFERDYEFVALQPEKEYPLNRGPIVSSKGLRIEQGEWPQAFEERHVKHSNALHAVVKERGPYMTGPVARLNLNVDKLHPRAMELVPQVCKAVGRGLPWKNSFLSLLARALETVHCLALSLDILRDYHRPARPNIVVEPKAGAGGAATEAPRGILWHRYAMDADGIITAARIIPPTSQNLAQIDDDLRKLAAQHASLEDEPLAMKCEHLIRNYDPCISCATHAIKVQIERL